MKHIIKALAIILAFLSLLCACAKTAENPAPETDEQPVETVEPRADGSGSGTRSHGNGR